MTDAPALRARSEQLAAPLPALLARAEHLSASVVLGDHGRRRAGLGDTFWQYRSAIPSDDARRIDWRRSARSDTSFVQEKEWQIAQTVGVWVDHSASMRFASSRGQPTKADRAQLLALAATILLLRGGERVGCLESATPPRRGNAQATEIAAQFGVEDPNEFGTPPAASLTRAARVLLVSDFFGDIAATEAAIATAAKNGSTGVLLQVVDPQEEEFPFAGRTIFESPSNTIRHETRRAAALRDRYLERLAQRRDRLEASAKAAGWTFGIHRTDQSPAAGLMWLYQTIEAAR